MNFQGLLRIAYEEARKSPDPSTHNAALLVTNDGKILVRDINRFPDGVEYTLDRWQRPEKYSFIEHAERNVCFAAAKSGISTNGLTMICPWAACAYCARCIIQCGIKELVTHQQAHDRSPDFWRQQIIVALTMLDEAGVGVTFYNGKIGDVGGVLHSGQLWNP